MKKLLILATAIFMLASCQKAEEIQPSRGPLVTTPVNPNDTSIKVTGNPLVEINYLTSDSSLEFKDTITVFVRFNHPINNNMVGRYLILSNRDSIGYGYRTIIVSNIQTDTISFTFTCNLKARIDWCDTFTADWNDSSTTNIDTSIKPKYVEILKNGILVNSDNFCDYYVDISSTIHKTISTRNWNLTN